MLQQGVACLKGPPDTQVYETFKMRHPVFVACWNSLLGRSDDGLSMPELIRGELHFVLCFRIQCEVSLQVL